MLVTTPDLAYTVAPAERSPLAAGLCGCTILSTALPSLLYQNSGFHQFGYRFSLDYIVFFVMLLAWVVAGSPGCGRRWWFGRGGQPFRRHHLRSLRTQFSYDDSFFPHGNN